MLKIGHTRAFKIQMFDSLAWMNYILLKAHYQLSHIKFYKKKPDHFNSGHVNERFLISIFKGMP